MKTNTKRAIAILPFPLLIAQTASATGGETLPFNAILDTVFANLTGPTARTLVGIALVLGLCAVMFGRDSDWAHKIGKVILCGAGVAGIPTILQLMGVSGLGGAEGWLGASLQLGLAALPVALLAWVATPPRTASLPRRPR